MLERTGGRLGVVLCALVVASSAAAAPARTAESAVEEGRARIRAELLVDSESVRPGDTFRVGVRFQLDDQWHMYWRNPGDSGLSTELTWNARGAEVGPLQWPFPDTFRTADGFIVTYGYDEEVVLFAEARAAPDAQGQIEIDAHADLLVCRINCIPATMSLRRTVKVGPETTPDPAAITVFDAAQARVPRPPAGHGLTAEASLSTPLTAGQPFEGLLALRPLAGDGELPGVEGDFFVPDRVEGLEVVSLEPDPAVPGHFAISGKAAPQLPQEPLRLKGVLRVGTEGFQAIELDLPLVSAAATQTPGTPAPTEATPPPAGSASAATMLLFAFLGGMLLNLMPCVFPVLALKVYGLARVASDDRRHLGVHAAAYAVGIVGSLLLLAGAVIGLRAAGQGVGWGFQFQEPLFVAAVCAVLVTFALNLFGVFRVGQPGTQLATKVDGAHGLSRSVGEGVLTVVLATPCSAPLLGAAVGFALASGALMTLATFAVLGLGLAAPFCALVLWPGLARRLPRPGPWMERLKQVLGFALLGTAAWLVWVMGGLTGVNGMGRLLAFLVVVALAGWVFGLSQDAARGRRFVGVVSAIALVVFGGVGSLRFSAAEASGPAGREIADSGARPWSEAAVQAALAEGRPSFVYFTADWCITCKFNERTVLMTDAVKSAFTDHDVAVFVGDWTRRDEAIGQALARHGRAGVPLYLVFRPGSSTPEVLPELLTQDLLLEAVARAAASRPKE